MTSAIRRQEPTPADPQDTVTAEIVRLETATETMAAYIGYLTNQILDEEDQPKPNAAKIKALQAQLDTVVDEKHAITSDSHDLIAKALYIYAPIMKALYGS